MRFLGVAMASAFALAAAPALAAGDQGEAQKSGAWMEMMDADGDGRVTEDEFKAGRTQQFTQQDANGDGTVTADEMAEWKQAQGAETHDMTSGMAGDTSKEDYEMDTGDMFEKLDVDKDGALTADEIDMAHKSNGADSTTIE